MKNIKVLIRNLKNNKVTFLEKGTYHIYQENCFLVDKIYCSNSSSMKNNPNGEKHSLFYLKNKKKVLIDGNGSTIYIHGPVTPFLFINCKNVTIKNLKIIKPNPSTLEFKVLESKPGEATIKINSENNYIVENNVLYWYENNNELLYYKYHLNEEDTITMMFYKDYLTYSPFRVETTRFPSLPSIKEIIEITKDVLKLSFMDNSVLQKGAIFQVRHTKRNEIGGLFINSHNITLRNINVNFTGDMGYIYQNCSDIRINNFNVKPIRDRLISSQADFFHFSNCYKNVSIENCFCSGAQDDVINVHSTYLKIVDINKDERSIVVKFPHHETFGFKIFNPGNRISFVKYNNLESFHQNYVRRVEMIDLCTQKIYLKNELVDVELDKDVVENLARYPSVIINNNHFKNIATRGILSTTYKDVRITNNIFENISMPILYVSNDCNYWFEGGRSGNIYFYNNRIITKENNKEKQKVIVEYAPVVIDKNYKGYVHKKLSFKNNVFETKYDLEPVIKVSYLKEIIIDKKVKII